jgi:hypothetical protein
MSSLSSFMDQVEVSTLDIRNNYYYFTDKIIQNLFLIYAF